MRGVGGVGVVWVSSRGGCSGKRSTFRKFHKEEITRKILKHSTACSFFSAAQFAKVTFSNFSLTRNAFRYQNTLPNPKKLSRS